MNNEILDEEISDNNYPNKLNSGEIMFSIFLGLTAFSLLSIAYNDYRLIASPDILTLISSEEQLIFKTFLGFLFLLTTIGIVNKIKQAYLILISIIFLISSFYVLELFTEPIVNLIPFIITYSIIIGILFSFIWKKRAFFNYNKLFYAAIIIGIILGNITHFFGETIIINMISIGIF